MRSNGSRCTDGSVARRRTLASSSGKLVIWCCSRWVGRYSSGGGRQRQLAHGVFHHRFPDRDDTQEDLMPWVTNAITPRGRQLGIRTDEPEADMGVEQDPQAPSNALSMSSGKGGSKC